MKTKRMWTHGGNGSNPRVIAEEGPGFVQCKANLAGSDRGPMGGGEAAPSRDIRIQPEQAGRWIFKPDEAASTRDEMQKESCAGVQ